MSKISLSFDGHYDLSKYELAIFRDNFKCSDDIYCASSSLTIDDSIDNAFQIIKNTVKAVFDLDCKIEAISDGTVLIRLENRVFITVHYDADDLWTKSKTKLTVRCFANPVNARSFRTLLKGAIVQCKSPVVEWHYMSQGSRTHTSIFLEDRPVIKKEYYPWLSEEPNAYIDRFMKSKCGLLILRGEPGTGKTSFIRNMLWHCDSKAMITYEEELFKSDDLFVDFLTEYNDVLIMEDADAFLESRIRTGNTTMTKFLNVSDGIINFPNKKLIISANTIDNEKIDEALMRPGRCFDAPIFRRLSFEETIAACNAAGIISPTEDRTYSLAEMFSNAIGESASSPKSGREKFGFGR